MNILTIDFEEWFDGLLNLKLKKEDCQKNYSRIENQMDYLLKTLNDLKLSATFFCVGRLAKFNQNLIHEIIRNKHEVALHSLDHGFINKMSQTTFEKDLIQNKSIIENIAGKKVIGYRAPYFSVNRKMDWFPKILRKHNIKYDSSAFPSKLSLCGDDKFDTQPFIWHGILELPISMFSFFKIKVPYSGGFYFRAMPFKILKMMINKNNYNICYFHPWEFDEEQPCLKNTSYREKLSHYGFLKNSKKKFEKIFKDKNFVSFEKYLNKIT